MSLKTFRVLCVALALLGLGRATAADQAVLRRSVVGSGGAPGEGAVFRLNGTAGQPAQGRGSAVGLEGHWGFWYGLFRPAVEPLPDVWAELALLPAEGPGDAVGPGGWLAVHGDLVYAVKGQGNHGLYRFDRAAQEWASEPLALIPPADKKKPIDDGCRGVIDEAGEYLYIVHGNKTRAFWRYDIGKGDWLALADVPAGPRKQGVDGGSDMVLVDGYIYLLKGGRNEFYRYNINAGNWTALAGAPGDPPRWTSGSWLAWDGEEAIYAHNAQQVDRSGPPESWAHYLYRYDITAGVWSGPLRGMPLFSPGQEQPRPAGAGGAGVYHDGRLLALKGENTLEFWQYDIDAATWQRLEDIGFSAQGPERAVAAGGYLVSDAAGELYALKGNRTNEFWYFGASEARPERSGVMAEKTIGPARYLRLGPNPLRDGRATLHYGLPRAGPVQVSVVDITGRSVLRQNLLLARTGTAAVELGGLSAGVYFVKLDAGDFRTTQKLVVQR